MKELVSKLRSAADELERSGLIKDLRSAADMIEILTLERTKENTANMNAGGTDAVSRQAVKEQMIKYGFHAPDTTVSEFVEDLSPVKLQPKIGHWVRHHEPYTWMGYATWSCSECDFYTDHAPGANYCSNCGAKMEGEIWDDKGSDK